MKHQSRSKVGFFPTPQEDELLDSLIYRYHYLAGHDRPLRTLQFLYGRSPSAMPKLLTNCVGQLFASLPPIFTDELDILRKHSMLPAFSRMLHHGKMAYVIHTSMAGRSVGVEDPYHSAHLHLVSNTLQCCPECIKEEEQELGFAYWHRTHQLQGVVVCEKHGCDLIQHCPHCGRDVRLPRSMDLPTSTCPACGKRRITTFSYPSAVWRLAKLAKNALKSDMHGSELRSFSNQVIEAVQSDSATFCVNSNQTYGAKYLQEVHYEDEPSDYDWLAGQFRKEVWGHTYSPIILQFRWFSDLLMVIDKLWGSWESFDRQASSYAEAA